MWSSAWTPVGPAVAPSAVLTLVGVRLRLRSGADAGVVACWAERVRAELDGTPDLTGYALQLTDGVLEVVSAWSRRASLAAFERGPSHSAARRELGPLVHPPVIDVWRAAAADLPPAWDEVRRRIRAAGERTRTRLAEP